MICSRCNGKGYQIYTYRGCIADIVKCQTCNGTGEIEQTNEEWFASLSTEEKAKALDLLMDGMSNLRFEIEEILNNGDFDMTHEEAIEIWLKEMHRNEHNK